MENETKVVIGDCDSLTNNGNKHSLSIVVQNVHAVFSTYAGLSANSNNTEITYFGLTKDDMYELARKIMEVANNIDDAEDDE